MDWKFGLLLLANVLFFLLLRRTRKKKWLNGLLTILFMTLATLTVLEAGYRLFFKKPGITETGNFGGSMNIPVALTGYSIKNIPRLEVTKTSAEGDTLYHVTYGILPDSGTNSLPINHRVGYRAPGGSDSLEVVFLGCSFTFGSGVPDTASMACRLGRLLHCNTVNYGGPGYGIHQVYQIFTHKYQHRNDGRKRVFVYTFIPDHIMRAKCIYSWCLNDPYFAVFGDSLRWLGPAYRYSGPGRTLALIRLLSLNRTLSFISDLGNNAVQQYGFRHVTEADYTRTRLMLEVIARQIRQRGDRFIILNWDDYNGLKLADGSYSTAPEKVNEVMAGAVRQGARVIAVSGFYDFANHDNFIPIDNHPSIRGNALMARELSRQILSDSIIPPQGAGISGKGPGNTF